MTAASDFTTDRWLTYAREVVTDKDHREHCQERGGSNPNAICAERGGLQRPANFAKDVRWPGYLGSAYGAGGVLWISNIHRNFDSEGLPPSFAEGANNCIRRWRDGVSDDASFLQELRAIYLRGLRRWLVGSWPGKALLALEVELESVAYTNVAKCQAVDTGMSLQRFCVARWPLRRIVNLLEPGLVLLTSETGLSKSGPARWPCDVVAFSQRNGVMMINSPWKPPGLGRTPSFDDWIDHLVSHWRGETHPP